MPDMSSRAPRLDKILSYNSARLMKPHVHGYHPKDLVVLHETISQDIKGLADIVSVEKYLASKDYGIHGMTDAEGHIAWALGLGSAIFWHAGGVNSRAIGIEQVSNIPAVTTSNIRRRELWGNRATQLKATARLLAAIKRAHPQIPLVYSDGRSPGITSHWDVSQHFPASQGHTDCHPSHKGGYFPIRAVIKMANEYYTKGVLL